MSLKKTIITLLTLACCVLMYIIYTFSGLKSTFADSIKENVVYKNYSDVNGNKESGNIQSKYIKNKVDEMLRKYFNISARVLEKRHKAQSYILVINKKTIYQTRKMQLDEANELFREGYCNIDQLKERHKQIEKSYCDFMNTITKLGHGFIQYTLINKAKSQTNLAALAFLNEHTKEVESALIVENSNGKYLGITKEESQNIAENFIEKNRLGGIKKCKFIRFGKDLCNIWYQDKNDSSKKVWITVSPYKNKVSAFSIKSSAKFYYKK